MANELIRELPSSLAEVEALILQLYEPRASEKVARIQETLQLLQRSPGGWQLADYLLGSADEKARFFGALTFIVRLNTDANSLSDEGGQAILRTLISWVIRRLQDGEGQLVLRKLCSALVTYFLCFSTCWTECVRHLLHCLSTEVAIPYSASRQSAEDAHCVRSISKEKSIVMFWFATTLVEEVGKTDPNSIKQHNFHQRVVQNLDLVVSLIMKHIADNVPKGSVGVGARQESLRCFQAWVSYSHRVYVDDKVILDPLQRVTQSAIVAIMDDDLYDISVELFSEVLTNHPRFLKSEDLSLLRSILNSPWAGERYKRLVNGDFEFESLQFGLLNIAFGDATLQTLARNLDADPQCQLFLHGLVGLLDAQGLAVHEDRVFVPALEFWNTFVEHITDWANGEDSTQHPPWFQAAQSLVMAVINNCWRKIQYPPSHEFSSWDSADRTAFHDARRDVSDLLEQYYVIRGLPLLTIFIDLVNTSLSARNWTELEATFFCLAQFEDCIRHESNRDNLLNKVFTASLFNAISDSNTNIPDRCMQSFLILVDAYPDYFERHDQYLTVLNIAFGVAPSPVLSKPAARSIVRLCSPCRHKLVPMIDAFLKQYLNIAYLPHIESHTKEGIMEAMASIIQAIPEDDFKIPPLLQLLSFLGADIERGLVSNAPATSFVIEAQLSRKPSELLLTPLRCLVSIAKGLRAPIDIPIDLEQPTSPSCFWTAGEGAVVQHKIIRLIEKIYAALHNNAEAMEVVCSILRMGLRESEPGPFVFPIDISAEFLIKASSITARPGTLIATACSIISSQRSAPRLEEVLSGLLDWVAEMLRRLGEPASDPETAQNGIGFMHRLFPEHIGVLLNHQSPSSLEYLLSFTLRALSGNDPLPKSAAADFWSTFVSVSNLADGLQLSVDGILLHVGPLLAQALVYNIGGNAARSELERISEPVKKMIARQARSKAWFEAALLSENFPSDHVPVQERLVFLQKIMSLRGARGTGQVVRDFWLACRGSNFAYAS